MAWNKNEWTYTRNVYHGCEKIFKYNENDEEISFFGQLDDDLPNGLGAISCNGKFVCGG